MKKELQVWIDQINKQLDLHTELLIKILARLQKKGGGKK